MIKWLLSFLFGGSERRERKKEARRIAEEARQIAWLEEIEKRKELDALKRNIFHRIVECDDKSKIVQMTKTDGNPYSFSGDYWGGESGVFKEGYIFEDNVMLIRLKISTHRDSYFVRKYNCFRLYFDGKKISNDEEWTFDMVKSKYKELNADN